MNVHKEQIPLTFTVVILSLLVISPFVLVNAKSPYDSGYDHGCDDAGISDSSDRYINQPEKGSSYHTSEFMDGYNSGFSSCSSSNNDYNQDYSPQQATPSKSQHDCTLSEAIGGGIGALAGEIVAPGIGGFVTGPVGSSIGKNMCENQ